MKITLKDYEWKEFLKSNEMVIDSLWELIPQQMDVIDVEEIVWSSKLLYHLEYKGLGWLVWDSDIDEKF